MARLNVLLNLHAHNISVNWEGHLVGHHFNLALLLLNCAAHVVHPLFKVLLQLLSCLDLLSKTLLVLVGLASHLIIVCLEVIVQGAELLLLGMGGLQVALNGEESPL